MSFKSRNCITTIITVLIFVFSAVLGGAEENELLSRSSLLDAPDGLKSRLRARGINASASMSNFFQSLASGDGNQDIESSGKGELFLTLDGHKLGFWKGLSLNLHGEFVYGEDTMAQGGGNIIPVNTALAFPRLGGHDHDISLVVTQRVRDHTFFTLGKFNMLDAASRTPLLGGGGIDTFMNLGLAAPISGVTPAYLVGSLLTHRNDFATFSLFIYDPRSAQDSDVLKHPFDDGVTFSLSMTRPATIWDSTSIHRFRGVYSTQDGTDLRDIPLLGLPPEAEAELSEKSGYWFFSYAFQHFLFQDDSDSSRGWGLFGQIAVSDGNPNPFEWSGFLGVGGNSPIAGRIHDRFGVAYFRYSLSSYLGNGISSVLRLDDEQGVEAFYSYAITQWFKISGNLQVIDPALSENDRAVYLGLRTQIKF